MNSLVTAPDTSKIALHHAEQIRLDTNERLNAAHQSEWGQFFTGAKLASWMASWFEAPSETLRLLDAGAGVGSLSAAFVSEICTRAQHPRLIEIVTYELDATLLSALNRTKAACEAECEAAGIELKFEVVNADFILDGVAALEKGLFAAPSPLDVGFNCAFLNPPYRKISSQSAWRRGLSSVGIEASNLYAAFVWLAARLLQPGGELIAITPRSWCNGPYFKPLRLEMRQTLSFRRFHVFESRREAFKDGNVLQENIVFQAAKIADNGLPILISSGPHPEDGSLSQRKVAPTEIFRPNDENAFVYLAAKTHTPSAQNAVASSLVDLGLNVSTGRVVDFRVQDSLRAEPDDENVAPMIYPLHFQDGFVRWPRQSARKSNALTINAQTRSLLCPAGVYVVVKRFSSKEQKKRICAAVFDSQNLGETWRETPVGFENHLNYFHQNGEPLPLDVALGLAIFLNSSHVDTLFRGFNGHTQVNATDLRSLPYPSLTALQILGNRVLVSVSSRLVLPPQDKIDVLVEAMLDAV